MDLDDDELKVTRESKGLTKKTKKHTEKFVEFTKDEEAVHVNILKNGIQVSDVLLGVAATIKIMIKETGKDKLEILKVVSEFIDSSERNHKNKEGGKEN